MSLPKNLISNKAQVMAEYLLIFIIFAFAVVLAFGGFNLGDKDGNGTNLNIKSVFDNALNSAIDRIKD